MLLVFSLCLNVLFLVIFFIHRDKLFKIKVQVIEGNVDSVLEKTIPGQDGDINDAIPLTHVKFKGGQEILLIGRIHIPTEKVRISYHSNFKRVQKLKKSDLFIGQLWKALVDKARAEGAVVLANVQVWDQDKYSTDHSIIIPQY